MTLVGNDEHVVGLVEAHVKAVEEEISYRTAEIMHVEDGKVTERWSFSDDTQAIIEFFRKLGGSFRLRVQLVGPTISAARP
jgi:ketosteroid isomerase-like protein